MLSTVTRKQPRHLIPIVRSLSTEPTTSTSSHLPPPPPPSAKPANRSRIHPAPRPTIPHSHQVLPSLPPSFGRNQILPVADSTRALLESIVAQFQAPIRYAFAYGSGVFEQDGYSSSNPQHKDGPMLDFMFAVTHASHWHSVNMNQFPTHYPMYLRMLGSDFVRRVQNITPGVWFNTFVPMDGVVSSSTTNQNLSPLTHPAQRRSSMASRLWTTFVLTCSTGILSTLPDVCINRFG
jgi:mitochondrial translocator assembly and maintenance protein 41